MAQGGSGSDSDGNRAIAHDRRIVGDSESAADGLECLACVHIFLELGGGLGLSGGAAASTFLAAIAGSIWVLFVGARMRLVREVFVATAESIFCCGLFALGREVEKEILLDAD